MKKDAGKPSKPTISYKSGTSPFNNGWYNTDVYVKIVAGADGTDGSLTISRLNIVSRPSPISVKVVSTMVNFSQEQVIQEDQEYINIDTMLEAVALQIRPIIVHQQMIMQQ